MIGFLKCLRSSWASKLDAHPLSFFLSFHTLIALVHPLHGNPYSFTLISIDGHLHSLLTCLVDVKLSPSFCLLPPSIPPIVLCPWLTLIYCVKSEKVWECISMNTIAWLTPGWAWFILCAKKREHNKTIWFCRDNFLLPCYFLCFMIFFLCMLEVLLFLMSIDFCLESYGSEQSCQIEGLHYVGQHSTSKILFLSLPYSRTSRS